MRLLVLGGTSFVGRHIVEAALDDGHEVTLFNRGVTNADLFRECEHRRGDRDTGDLQSLSTGEWDAVVDVNGYVPRQVEAVASHLAGRAGTYCFISTGSVYADLTVDTIDESAPVKEGGDPNADSWTVSSYGPLKVLCERAASSFDGDTLVVRPGIVAGPHDPTGRFTYWVRRMARGGRVLGPPRTDQPVQVVHARDQGDFVVRLLRDGATGTFNSVGPDDPVTFADLLEACRLAAGADHEASVVWAGGAPLPLPLVLPADGSMDALFRVSNARSRAAGLRNRPLVETAADTLAWDRAAGAPPIDAGPTAEEEAAALAATGTA